MKSSSASLTCWKRWPVIIAGSRGPWSRPTPRRRTGAGWNRRRVLNYGHTIGHAVEAASGYDLLHGEAVAVGIVAAGLIEVEMGLAEPGRLERVQGILERLGVPVKLPPQIAEESVLDLLKHDKKAVGRWPRFVLIARLGEAYTKNGQYAVEVERRIVENVLNKLK